MSLVSTIEVIQAPAPEVETDGVISPVVRATTISMWMITPSFQQGHAAMMAPVEVSTLKGLAAEIAFLLTTTLYSRLHHPTTDHDPEIPTVNEDHHRTRHVATTRHKHVNVHHPTLRAVTTLHRPFNLTIIDHHHLTLHAATTHHHTDDHRPTLHVATTLHRLSRTTLPTVLFRSQVIS